MILNSIYFSHLSSPAPVHPIDTQAASRNGSVLLVSVIEIVFPGFYGWKRSEDENSAVFVIDRLKGVGYVLVFH